MPENNNANVGKERLLSIDIKDIDLAFIQEMFAAYYDKTEQRMKEANFNANDHVLLTPNEYKYIKDKEDTTLGRILFNRYVLERTGLIEQIGYYNNPITKKSLGALDRLISNLLMIDKIESDTYAAYIDSRDRLGFWCSSFMASHVTNNILEPIPEVEKRKDELFKQYAPQLNSEHAVEQIMATNAIEKELMDMVRKKMENDPGYDLYASGDGNFDNNYKTINVMRGAVFNNATQKYDVVESSLMNGIKKKDITPFSNSVLAGAYPSAVATAEAGYMSKIFLALLQSESIDPNPKSDCGTKVTIPITVTEKNKTYLVYRNISENGKVVKIDFTNIDSYVGKVIHLFSPQCCTHKKICAKCAGDLFHLFGVENIGLLTTDITDKLLNLKLKSKHDLSQSAGAIDMKLAFIRPTQNASVDKYGTLIAKTSMKLFIPKIFDESFNAFVIENTFVNTMGIIDVRFYDKTGKEIEKNIMSIPCMLSFNIYGEIQETADEYIIEYDPGAEVVSLNIQKTFTNCEYYINQIYLRSTKPLIPYNLMTEYMFRCIEMNSTDLTGSSIVYELLARAVCKDGNKPFAVKYGASANVDPMSYEKIKYRDAVQRSGILQGLLFEDISTALNVGLSQSLDGIDSTYTPLEKVIKA